MSLASQLKQSAPSSPHSSPTQIAKRPEAPEQPAVLLFVYISGFCQAAPAACHRHTLRPPCLQA